MMASRLIALLKSVRVQALCYLAGSLKWVCIFREGMTCLFNLEFTESEAELKNCFKPVLQTLQLCKRELGLSHKNNDG
jgi:hypothetical protein